MLHAPCCMLRLSEWVVRGCACGCGVPEKGDWGVPLHLGVAFVEVDAMLLDQRPNEVVTAFAVEALLSRLCCRGRGGHVS